MAIIKTLAVSVTARTSKFEKGMRRVTRSLDRTVRKFTGFGLRGIGAVAGLAGAGGLGLLVRQQSKVIDQTAKMSRRLGITFRDLSAMRLVAEQAGVQFTQLDIGLQRMTRRIAEAAKGTGEARGALRELGLDAASLVSLAPDRQFQAIARALSLVGPQADRVRLGFKLFDAEGVGLINITADAIDRMRVRMERLGLNLTVRQIRGVERYNDSLSDMGALVRGLGMQISAGFVPHLDTLLSRIVGVTEKWGGMSGIAQRTSELLAASLHNIELFWTRVALGAARANRALTLGPGLRVMFAALAPRAGRIGQMARVGGALAFPGTGGGRELDAEIARLERRVGELEGLRGGPRTAPFSAADRPSPEPLSGAGPLAQVVGGVINRRLVDPNIRGRVQGNEEQKESNRLLQDILNALLDLSRA